MLYAAACHRPLELHAASRDALPLLPPLISSKALSQIICQRFQQVLGALGVARALFKPWLFISSIIPLQSVYIVISSKHLERRPIAVIRIDLVSMCSFVSVYLSFLLVKPLVP